MKPQNIKEAKALIKRYRSITSEEIKKTAEKHPPIPFLCFDDTPNPLTNVPRLLTGFGSTTSCTLCKDVCIPPNCTDCIYKIRFGCIKCRNKKTYDTILNARTPEQLIKAFRDRANHIENILKEWEEPKMTKPKIVYTDKLAYEIRMIDNDINGNPRYIIHFCELGLCSNQPTDKTREAGLNKYRGKQYGEGYFVFSSYTLKYTLERIEKILGL